jgi:hypothetical protein
MPSGKHVFIEENHRGDEGYNSGGWYLPVNQMDINNPNTWWWYDPGSVWHNRKSTLNFADGRAEMHNWVDERTLELASTYDWNEIQATWQQPDNPDILYMMRGSGHKGSEIGW